MRKRPRPVPVRSTLALIFAASCHLLPAQAARPGLAWQLPDSAVVEFHRQAKQEFAAIAPTEKKPPSSAAVRDDLELGWLRNPPLLFAAELDHARQRSTESPTCFWDVIPFLALDLSCNPKGDRLRYELPRLAPIGDLLVVGRATALEEGGTQTLRFALTSMPPEERDGPKKYFRLLIAQHYDHAFKGELEIQRRIDVEKGRVIGFAARLTGEFQQQKGATRRRSSVLLEEDWELATVHPGPEDAAFGTSVHKAIEKGAQYLRAWVKGLRSKKLRADPPSDDISSRRSYNSGRLALCLLAMVKADLPRDDPVLVAGFDELRRRVIHDTYSLGLAVMALEASYAPVGERNDLIHGLIDRPRPRLPSAADQALLTGWCRQILANRDTRMKPDQKLAFNYTPGARFDHSVNQYGLLGLYSGHLCGVAIEPSVWVAAARHLLAEQRDDGWAPVSLELMSHLERERSRQGGGPTPGATRAAPALIQPMGWAYGSRLSRSRLANGSMTTAGIAGLTICAAVLQHTDLGQTKASLLPEIRRALDRGFAFMGRHFSVRANCGYAPRADTHRYYYLYGLERAFELSGIATVMGRDWYHEGARLLLAWQADQGSWPAAYSGQSTLESTAFAVLFLKKSALPVFSGPR